MPDVNAFGYEYLLTIGNPEQLIRKAVPTTNLQSPKIVAGPENPSTAESVDSSNQDDYRTIPSKFIDIRDKQIRATIKTSKEAKNPCTIKIYNLTEEQIAIIKNDSSVVFRAGYKTQIPKGGSSSDLPLIYVGQVVSVSTSYEGPNKVTNLVCSDAKTVWRNVKISVSWPPGTQWQSIVINMLELAQAMGIPQGQYLGDTQGLTPILENAEEGYNLVGTFEEELNRLLDSLDYRMYMVLGKYYVEPKYIDPTVEVVIVRSNNIKGSVEQESDGSIGLSGDRQEKTGVKFKTYLNGNISVNKYLTMKDLRSNQFEGDYKIMSVEHELDYEGNTWETIVSATRVK